MYNILKTWIVKKENPYRPLRFQVATQLMKWTTLSRRQNQGKLTGIKYQNSNTTHTNQERENWEGSNAFLYFEKQRHA